MPRYYCDYCDAYLTHDSISVRKQHNSGYKHKTKVREYYEQIEKEMNQSLIDQRIKDHLAAGGAYRPLAPPNYFPTAPNYQQQSVMQMPYPVTGQIVHHLPPPMAQYGWAGMPPSTGGAPPTFNPVYQGNVAAPPMFTPVYHGNMDAPPPPGQ